MRVGGLGRWGGGGGMYGYEEPKARSRCQSFAVS